MRAVVALLLVALLAVTPATAATPDDLSADPLDRAALLALPSVYELRVVIDVPALRERDGTRIALTGDERRVVEGGTAFGVAPGGWLATAAHVVAPDPEDLAALAYQRLQAFSDQPHGDADVAAWLERTGARPVGARIVSVTATQADAGDGARGSRSYRALQVEPSDTADLALVRIGPEAAPALEFDESASIGTPVLTVGFGRGSVLTHGGTADRTPALRVGELSTTGTLEREDPPRQAIAITVPVQQGDSGAPVIDPDGRVRGVVIQRTGNGGIAERATELRQLMDEQGVTPGAGLAAEEFREGMRSLWALEPAAARVAFDATLELFPDHTLAARERARAAVLQTAGYDLGGDRSDGLLLGLGALAGTLALGCAVGLALRPAGPGPSARGR